MLPYSFPLAKILEYRRLEYERVLSKAFPLFRRWSEISVRLSQIRKEQLSLEKDKGSLKNFEEFFLKERYFQQLRLMDSQVKEEQEKLRFRYMEAKGKALKAFQSVDLLEKLAKSSFEAYKSKVKRKEKNLLDDMLLMWYRSREDD